MLHQGENCRLGAFTLKGAGILHLGNEVTIEDNVLIDLSPYSGSSIALADRVKVKFGCVLRTYGGTISVGKRTSLGEHVVILAHGGVAIGDDCGVGPHCSVHASSHIFSGQLPIRFQGESARGCRIEHNVWLGAGVRVLDGVVIGSATAVGANSVVTDSLPPGVVAVGAPCRVVGETSGTARAEAN